VARYNHKVVLGEVSEADFQFGEGLLDHFTLFLYLLLLLAEHLFDDVGSSEEADYFADAHEVDEAIEVPSA